MKSYITYILVFLIVGFFGYYLHHYMANLSSQFSLLLKQVYIFHATFSLVVCIGFQIVSKIKSIAHQLGFIYIGFFVLKIFLFSILFYSQLFEESLTKQQSGSLLIPVFLFLFLEVYFISKIIR